MKKRVAKIKLTEQPKNAAQPKQGELTEKDLDAVAGGAGMLTEQMNVGMTIGVTKLPSLGTSPSGSSGINALGYIPPSPRPR
jgi:hypothetical protein